jgi:hypothetical protein
MAPTDLGDFIREHIRGRMKLTELAERTPGLSYQTVRSIAEGRRGHRPAPKTIHSLAVGLGVDEGDLVAVCLQGQGYTRLEARKRVAAVTSELVDDDGRPTREVQERAGKTEVPALGSRAHLDDLARSVRDLRSKDRERAFRDGDRVKEIFRSKAALSDEAMRKVAICDAIQGVACHEENDEPPEKGRHYLKLAQEEAHSIGDLGLEVYALCNHAEWIRKLTDALGQANAEGYFAALSLFETTFEKLGDPKGLSTGLRGLYLLCVAEKAKVLLGQDDKKAFRTEIDRGREWIQRWTDSGWRPMANNEEVPLPEIDGFGVSCFRDSELRGMAKFGGFLPNEMRAVAWEARQVTGGLAIVQDKGTLNLALGEGLLKYGRQREDYLEGVKCLGAAFRFSKADGFERQLASARKVLRRVKLLLPLVLDARCSWCWNQSLELGDGVGYKSIAYRCNKCQRVVIPLN